MRFFKMAVIVTLSLLFITLPVLAEKKTAPAKKAAVSKKQDTDLKCMGKKLLTQIWENMKTTNMKEVEKTLAKGFQSVHQFGADDRDQQIKLIKNLKLSDYTLTKIKITQNGPVIVATYFVAVAETIKGKRLVKKAAPRLSMFLKTADGWKWIAHANLRPLK